MAKPLVTLTIICYKAERYVREAIKGALSQTYSPLEIIFSDDCSPDDTFRIIQEETCDYNGPHSVVLNRNEKNLGIGAHVSKVWYEIAKGDWIVVSAGDDVSLPGRIQRLMEVADPQIGVIHHDCNLIDENSNLLPHWGGYKGIADYFKIATLEDVIRHNLWLRGSCMCINRSMLKLFQPLDGSIVNEDIVLAYRGFYYGGIEYLYERLMNYRIHSKSISFKYSENTFKDYKSWLGWNAHNSIMIYRQVLKDNEVMKLRPEFLKELENENVKNEIDLYLFGNGQFRASFFGQRHFYKNLVKLVLLYPYWYVTYKKNSSLLSNIMRKSRIKFRYK